MDSIRRGQDRKSASGFWRPLGGFSIWQAEPIIKGLARLSQHTLGNERGAALLFSLLVVIVLATAIFAFTDASHLEARLARNFRDGTRAFYLARAGVEYAVALLAEDEDDFDTLFDEWAQGPHELEFEDGRVEVGIQDEERKLNVNLLASEPKAMAATYSEIFQRLFDELEISNIFLSYLADWVDADEEETISGGEGAFYEALPNPYPVKNASLDTLSELAAVGNAGSDIFEKLGVGGSEPGARIDENPYLTVSSTTEVNINTAGPSVLASLSQSITHEIAKEMVSYRESRPFEKTSDLRNLPVVRDVFGDIQEIITTESTNFLIVATAEVNGVVRRIRAHVEREVGAISIQYWSVD